MKTTNDKLKLKNNVSATNYSEAVKEVDVPSFRDPSGANTVPASPIFPVDPNVNPMLNQMPCVLEASNSAGAVASVTTRPAFGPIDETTNPSLLVASMQYVLDPISNVQFALRSPSKYGFASCTTVAVTDVFTPTAGKKFRLLRAIITPDAGMAAGGLETIVFTEETLGAFLTIQVYLPIAASIVQQPPIVVDLTPNGYLSTTVTKKFQIALGTAVTAGGIGVTFIGTEE